MVNDLKEKSCKKHDHHTHRFLAKEIDEHLEKLSGWKLENYHHIAKVFSFSDFSDALAFTNRIGDIAKSENHHPDILVSWNKVKLRIFSHAIDGLTENDFILAAKIDAIEEKQGETKKPSN